MNRTTIKLRLTLADLWRINERRIRDASIGAALIVAVLLAHALLRPPAAPTPAPMVMRQPAPAVIVIATARPLPTLTPAPTQTPAVIVREVYVEVPTPEPEVIYVAVEQPTAPEPTAAPEMAPQTASILDRGAWAVAAATARAEQ